MVVLYTIFCTRGEQESEYRHPGETKMDKWKCTICDWIYDPAVGDPDGGVAPGTPFEQIPDSWVCPVCGASKDAFIKI